MELDYLGPALPHGWWRPSRKLVSNQLMYQQNGLAHPASPHLYVATPSTPVEVFDYPVVAEGVQMLHDFCNDESGSPIKAVGMAYAQLARAADLPVRTLAISAGMPDARVENLQSNAQVYHNAYYVGIEEEGGIFKRERCFSVPGMGFMIWRYNAIMLYLPGMEPVRVDGTEAWFLQHEIDHEDGLVIAMRWQENPVYPPYAVPDERSTEFNRVFNPDRDDWPIAQMEQWYAMQTGEFDLDDYFQYL